MASKVTTDLEAAKGVDTVYIHIFIHFHVHTTLHKYKLRFFFVGVFTI